MKYNGELKQINTEVKAYLLGFLYGDGCIRVCIGHNGYLNYSTTLAISKIDEDLIFKLKKEFPFFNLNRFNNSKYGKNVTDMIMLRKQSKELYNDLLLNGVHPRKSYENKYKLRIPNINNILIPHFIRGFFDADGSVYTLTNRPNLIFIEFSSVSKNFIIELHTYLQQQNINTLKIIEKFPNGKRKQSVYILTLTKTLDVHKLINLMYNDHTITLKRKADKCLTHRIVNKVLDRNIVCPYCNSARTTINGIRGNSIRYECVTCKRGFSKKLNPSEQTRLAFVERGS